MHLVGVKGWRDQREGVEGSEKGEDRKLWATLLVMFHAIVVEHRMRVPTVMLDSMSYRPIAVQHPIPYHDGNTSRWILWRSKTVWRHVLSTGLGLQ